jgi:DNA-binding NtrC family response regulator
MSACVLVVDNDVAMADMLRQHLESEGHTVITLTSGREALRALEGHDIDVVLTDLVMDDVDGMAMLREAQRRDPQPRVILMTAFASLETAIEAIRLGAYDYLTKPFKLAQASVAIRRALDDRRLREENRRLRAEVDHRFGVESIVGHSKPMLTLFGQIRAVAASDATVLLLGESGTGKELVARALHRLSPRKDKTFVPVNCAAIPEPLLESELFGHEKGAFTGADRRRRGLFAEANSGTLFLDEIGDLPAALQAKILRTLQDRIIRPVGGREDVQLDLRVIAATHRDLPALVKEGRFREDLYYRLAVLPIRLPSLRERPGDIMLLATIFLERAAERLGKSFEGFDDSATAWLLAHRWPGNVRELENVVERAATLAQGPKITRENLGVQFAADAPAGALRPTLEELEHQYMQRVLEEAGGDKRIAARILGVSVRTLQRKVR